MRVVREIGLLAGSVPGNILPPKPAPTQRRMPFSKTNHVLEETENVLVLLELVPVEPSGFAVLVIGIVIAELRVQEFVAGPKHWDPVRQHEKAEKVLYLPAPQGQHLIRHPLIPFVTTVPTVVRVGAVLVVVAIRPVVLLVVGDEVVQRKAIMRSQEIHTLISVISIEAIIGEKVVASIKTAHEVGHHSRIAFHESTYIITKPSVPL